MLSLLKPNLLFSNFECCVSILTWIFPEGFHLRPLSFPVFVICALVLHFVSAKQGLGVVSVK